MSKRLLADFALANARVAIHARAKISFRVVQMKRQYVVQTDQAFDLADRVVPTFFRAQIETRFEEMRCIQTNSETFRSFHLLKNLSEMFDPMTETTPLPRGIFQRDSDRRIFGDAEGFIQSF